MLTEIRRQLQQRGAMSLADLARRLDADPAAVEGMLDHWIRKGKVCEIPRWCEGCTQCDPATIRMYRWLDPRQASVARDA
jgi:hypothetical protein